MASISDSHTAVSLLLSRVDDTVDLCDRRNYAQFLGFLDQAEQQQVAAHLAKCRDVQWLFYGGHKDAERRFLGVFPSYMEPDESVFPLRAVAFFYRSERSLTHRDVLGTLMSQGIRRECIGDILCADGYSVVFLRDDIADYVCDQTNKIGGEGVRVQRDYTGELPRAHSYLAIRDTVASPRLDAVVKCLLKCSREQAAVLIQSDAVSVNHIPVGNVSAHVEESAVISVRGHGRFVIDCIGPETKKGRLHFEARKFV